MAKDCGYKTPCWIWGGWTEKDGYTKWRGRWVHRWACEEAHGPIPPGYDVDHLCCTRGCVNPAHLEAVSKAVNVQRSRKAKLTPDLVREIRSTDGTLREVAQLFGVHHTTIMDIRLRRTWANIED